MLYAKGDYIMNLDHDDFFFDDDVFDTAYKASENGLIDIISFMYVHSNNYYSDIYDFKDSGGIIRHNGKVYQPNLSVFIIFKDDEFCYHDYTIWAKAFKNSVYKKATNFLTPKRYKVFITYNEDLFGIFVLSNVAESYKFIRKYGVYHIFSPSTTSNTAMIESRIFMDTFLSEVFLDLSKNKNKKYAATFFYKRSGISNEKNNKYAKKVLIKILNCKYIEEKFKTKLKEKYAILLNSKFSI